MFERFSDSARQSVVVAQEEARALHHGYIGTEHLLLALLRDPSSPAGMALHQLGVGYDTTRDQIETLIGVGDAEPRGHIPFTSRAKKVLELSLREALGLGHNYIGSEHIVLGLVREGEGVAMQVLEQQGASASRIRDAVATQLGSSAAARNAAGPRATAGPLRTEGAESVLDAARQLAGTEPVGTHHLLEAIALLDGSLGSNALAALGVDRDAIAAKIDELGVEGTSDITPEVGAARQMDIHLDDDGVRIVLGDDVSADLVGRLVESMGNPIRGATGSGSALVGVWQAIVSALQDLAGHLEPDERANEGQSKSTIVRAAIRNRLRRRQG